ncbi:MAG: nuclear transport factor 2 family protein [Bacteroidetes bacterium]|nr:nuclear transport factor 2 family protein [Bacteroidota bacterium]
MKRLLIFTGFLIAAYTIKAQSADQKAVQQAVIGIFDGISAADLQVVKTHATPDLTILENGIVWNMDTVAAKITQLKALTSYHRDNHLDFIQTNINENTAWVSYHNSANVVMNERNSTRNWLESAFLIKNGGVWKVQLLHSTVVAK